LNAFAFELIPYFLIGSRPKLAGESQMKSHITQCKLSVFMCLIECVAGSLQSVVLMLEACQIIQQLDLLRLQLLDPLLKFPCRRGLLGQYACDISVQGNRQLMEYVLTVVENARHIGAVSANDVKDLMGARVGFCHCAGRNAEVTGHSPDTWPSSIFNTLLIKSQLSFPYHAILWESAIQAGLPTTFVGTCVFNWLSPLSATRRPRRIHGLARGCLCGKSPIAEL
jgi:hypothetical protein